MIRKFTERKLTTYKQERALRDGSGDRREAGCVSGTDLYRCPVWTSQAGLTNGEAVVLELVSVSVDRLTPALIYLYKYNHFIPAEI